MLKIDHVFGTADSGFVLDKSKLTGDVAVDSRNGYVAGLVGGRVATTDANGNVKLCDGKTEFAEGFIINDASGYFMENTPALASGIVTVLVGGGVCNTDQVVEENIVSGDKLYVGTSDNVGLLTKVDPTGDGSGTVFAIARSGNSAADKTVKVRFL
jgi:hypothetical protein